MKPQIPPTRVLPAAPPAPRRIEGVDLVDCWPTTAQVGELARLRMKRGPLRVSVAVEHGWLVVAFLADRPKEHVPAQMGRGGRPGYYEYGPAPTLLMDPHGRCVRRGHHPLRNAA